MKNLKQTALLLALAAAFFTFGQKSAQAQEIQIGGHMGALGSNSSTKIGYGANLTFVPSDVLGLMLDATFAKFDGGNYFSSSPSLLFYLPSSEDLKFAGLIGGGFHKFEGVDTKFGLNVGATADFYVAKNFVAGAMVRYQPVFDASDIWNVFITAKFSFSAGDGW